MTNQPSSDLGGAEKSRQILVVEDEVLVRMAIADELRDAGFAVIEAGNADEALSVLRTSSRIDLIASDIDMPRGSINGLELGALVREQWPGVKFLVVSSHVRTGTALFEVADACLAKTEALSSIVSKVREILGEGGND
ncbi:MAG: response regulator [Rhodomicrobiaceae bacterium]